MDTQFSSTRGPGTLRINAGGIAVASFANNEARASLSPRIANALSSAGLAEEDLLHLRYPLVHEGANKNQDVFTAREMKQSFHTLVDTPLDKDHSMNCDDIVGKHYNAEYAEEGGKGVIYCDGYIYAKFYPDLAAKLQDGAINGVSMETHFGWSERRTEGRVLHDLTFIGAGLVRVPADPKAIVSLASRSRVDVAKYAEAAVLVSRILKEGKAHG